MGHAARRRETEPARTHRPRLRVVATKRAASTSAASCRANQRCQQYFMLFAITLAAAALFGLGRVALSAHAAETSFDSADLRKAIKAERLSGDMLEIEQSALATPSRIEAIAGASMKMSQAAQVSYMSLGPRGAARPTVVRAATPAGPHESSRVKEGARVSHRPVLAGMLATLMDMAAGEAHVLLVGDVGLASSR